MELTFLGTSASTPTVFRSLPAIALKLDEGSTILFDCGEGTQRQMMRCGTSFMSVDKIFISHFHCDHLLGLSGLLQTMNINSRENQIDIYGPEGIEELVKNILKTGYFKLGFDLMVHTLKNCGRVSHGNYSVECRENNHCKNSLAFAIEEKTRRGKFYVEKAKNLGIPPGPLYRRLQEGETIVLNGKRIEPNMVLGPPRKGRKMCYSGDTAYCENVIELARESDVLIHDSTFSDDMKEEAGKFGHSTATDAAKVAKAAKAKKLFLFHISPRYNHAKVLENEAKKIFENSTVAEDFMKYRIRYKD
jgi:ribonuclease Z